MKKIWQFIGGLFIFFRKHTWITPLLLVGVIIIQFVLLGLICFRVNNFQSDFEIYRNDNSKRTNQIYSQVFLLNQRVGQVLEK
ncbi:hypothetical protein HQ571_01420 [Candidatus Kuenenbacteria bacterium]|nr:hypothetical protein [Candidatus Kuenenbacteria bacterium]